MDSYRLSRDDCLQFSEFDFRSLGDGRSASARYANNSNYRNDSLIRKESKHDSPILQCTIGKLKVAAVCVSSLLIAEIKRIIKDSEIMKYGIGSSVALP